MVGNFVADHQDRFLAEMGQWVRDGLVQYREDIRPGLAETPAVFAEILSGGNFGKTLIQVAEDPTRS